MRFVRSLHSRNTHFWFNVCSSSPDAYSTLDQRGRRNTLDNTLEPADKDGVQVNTGHIQHTDTLSKKYIIDRTDKIIIFKNNC